MVRSLWNKIVNTEQKNSVENPDKSKSEHTNVEPAPDKNLHEIKNANPKFNTNKNAPKTNDRQPEEKQFKERLRKYESVIEERMSIERQSSNQSNRTDYRLATPRRLERMISKLSQVLFLLS